MRVATGSSHSILGPRNLTTPGLAYLQLGHLTEQQPCPDAGKPLPPSPVQTACTAAGILDLTRPFPAVDIAVRPCGS